MKIIKKGKKPSDQVFRATCTQCKSIIEATRSELVIGGGDYRSDYEEFGHEDCPVCGAKHIVFYPIKGK